ncbi:hypothetical protein FH972_014860 [Carpinus fangiana]|uniref:Uncharacterized protein n=1 Tax=Carpinus fangiana TaxID=176857 RepID=A0A5N6RCU2_9ROSI|nr:hypothetical protein FH972_014860 [Carpinus fangiana]
MAYGQKPLGNKPAFQWIHGLMKELNTEIACVHLEGVHVIPAITLVPWTNHWKKMRKVVASNVINPTTLHRLLCKRTEKADNLVRFVCKHSEKSTSVVHLRLAIHHYCGNVMRMMIFNKRYFGKGSNDGGLGVEVVGHVESLWSLLTHIYAFVMLDYIPCLKVLDLDGHE